MSHLIRLDIAAAIVGVLTAVVFFPLFFNGVSGFWENLTEWGGRMFLSMGQSKVILWLFLVAGGAYSAYWNLPRWFPHFFHR